jgi:hypothetical protein
MRVGFPAAENAPHRQATREVGMLTILAIVLGSLWLIGVATSHTMGGLIHVLLVATVTVVLFKVFLDRGPSTG